MSAERVPSQPKTIELEKVTVPRSQLDAVLLEVRMSREESANRHVETNQRISSFEAEVRAELADLRRGLDASIRPTLETQSKVNLAQDAAIATLVVKVTDVESSLEKAAKERADTAEKVEAIHGAVTGFFANKKVRAVGRVLFFLAMTYAAGHGLKVLP